MTKDSIMSNERYTEYDDLAWFYNKFMARRFLNEVTPAMEKLWLPKLPKGSKVLDICCGNGQLAQDLTEAGMQVTGIDASEEMLVYARTNAPNSEFHVKDARDFTLDEKFDAAISTCDGLNHIMTIEELQQAFANIGNVLKDGAYFLFDLNSWDNYVKYWKTGSSGKVLDDCALIAVITFEEDKGLGKLGFTMFRLHDGAWKRSDVMLLSQHYPEDKVSAALKEAGFSSVDIYNDDRNMGWPEMARTFYLARK
ncbi:MAG: class I SAM-dependent methyltransferase [Candidatus Zixiibacteriota bacterium]